MNKIFYTSDTHFSHHLLCKIRGFDSIAAMDNHLIETWNSVVPKDGVVYHLGDWTLKRGKFNPYEFGALLNRLNGKKFTVNGNHDIEGFGGGLQKGLIEAFEIGGVRDLGRYHEQRVGNQEIVISHYPIVSWNKMRYGSWHLYGHCHNSLQRFVDKNMEGSRMLDVGVDSVFAKFGYYGPVGYETVKEYMSKKAGTVVDHHKEAA